MSDDPIALAASGQLVGIREMPGYYVSTDGRIWSSWVRANWVIDSKTIRPLAMQRDKGGYIWIMTKIGGKMVKQLMHRLILETFVARCPDGMEACHANGVRDDNRLENLRWGTRLENAADRILHRTHPGGEKNPRAKLTEKDVVEIFALRRDGVLLKEIARRKGVSMILVQKILARRLWPHVEI